MKIIFLWILNFIILVWIFLLSLMIVGWWHDYNSQGRYFNELEGVVYKQDALEIYLLLMFIFISTGMVSWVYTWKLYKIESNTST